MPNEFIGVHGTARTMPPVTPAVKAQRFTNTMYYKYMERIK
jgi:hypothetical protein